MPLVRPVTSILVAEALTALSYVVNDDSDDRRLSTSYRATVSPPVKVGVAQVRVTLPAPGVAVTFTVLVARPSPAAFTAATLKS